MSSQPRPAELNLHQPEPDCRVSIEYLGHLDIAVSGTFTKTIYRFTRVQPVQQVDQRDSFYLVSSGLFRVAS